MQGTNIQRRAGGFLRTVLLSSFVIEIVLFLATAGALSFLAETGRWILFSIVLCASTVLFIFVALSRTKPLLEWIERRAEKQQRLLMRTERFGIADIFNMQIFDEQEERNRETRRIVQEGATFSLLSLTAASYIDPGLRRHWDALKSKISDGAPFRLLLQDPFCEEKVVRDRLNTAGNRPDSKFRFDLLANLHNTYSNVKIKFTASNVYCALFFTEKELIYDPYHLGKVEDRIENYFLSFRVIAQEMRGDGHPYYRILRSHFEALWSSAEDIETFWARNARKIARSPSRDALLTRRMELQ